MLRKSFSRYSLAAVAVIALLLTFVGLPFHEFINIRAQYAPYASYVSYASEISAESACGGTVTYQVRLFADTVVYGSDTLLDANFVISTQGVPKQKYLVCDSDLSNTSYLKIFVAGKIAYISADAGQLVPRGFNDSQN